MAIPKILIGGAAALLMATGGFFLWQGLSETPDPALEALPPPESLPVADASLVGTPPPEPPEARAATREERRFQRHDRNRDGIITRVEMMSSRTAAFRRLDSDGNNLLSFEEWAVATGNRFAQADKDRSGTLTPPEFATTAPPRRPRNECRC